MTTPYAGTSQASTLKQGPESRTNQAANNNMRPYMAMHIMAFASSVYQVATHALPEGKGEPERKDSVYSVLL